MSSTVHVNDDNNDDEVKETKDELYRTFEETMTQTQIFLKMTY